MVVFGIETDKDGAAHLKELQRNLSEPSGFMFMYSGSLKKLGSLWVLRLEPNFIKLHLMGVFLCAGSLILYPSIGGWSFAGLIPALFMMSTYVFWSTPFYQLLLIIGFKKKGVKQYSFLSPSKTLERLL